MKLKTFGPDGRATRPWTRPSRRNIWVAFGIISIVPFVGWWLGGLVELGCGDPDPIGINGDPVKRQHWFDKFAGGTQVMKIG